MYVRNADKSNGNSEKNDVDFSDFIRIRTLASV